MRDTIFRMISDTVENVVNTVIGDDQTTENWDVNELNDLRIPIIPIKPVSLSKDEMERMNKKVLIQKLKEEAVRIYEDKEAEFPDPEQIREVERVILLKVIDRKWMDHIDDMDQLRQGIGLQSLGQRDPLLEYKFQGFDMFEAMTDAIREETVKALMHIKIEQKVEREEVAKVTGTNKDDSAPKGPVRRTGKKIQPNDPCPCGSGRKYKQCCGR